MTSLLLRGREEWECGSFHVGNVAAYGADVIGLDGSVAESSVDGVFQFVRGGCGAGRDAKLFELVINATVIEKLAGGAEDGGFRRDRSLGAFDELVAGIAQSSQREVVGAEMSSDLGSGFRSVWVDQIEIGVVSEFFAERLVQRGVAIGNGAIGADEEEYDNTPW